MLCIGGTRSASWWKRPCMAITRLVGGEFFVMYALRIRCGCHKAHHHPTKSSPGSVCCLIVSGALLFSCGLAQETPSLWSRQQNVHAGEQRCLQICRCASLAVLLGWCCEDANCHARCLLCGGCYGIDLSVAWGLHLLGVFACRCLGSTERKIRDDRCLGSCFCIVFFL